MLEMNKESFQLSLEQMQADHAAELDASLKDLETQAEKSKASSDAAAAERSKLAEQLKESQQELQVGRE